MVKSFVLWLLSKGLKVVLELVEGWYKMVKARAEAKTATQASQSEPVTILVNGR
jgi:hypothetical protein